MWLWGHLPPQILPLLSFFPQFYSRKWPKRDFANLPRLCSLPVNRNNPNLAWDCSPKPFFQKSDWDCSVRPFYWFILGLHVKFVGLFGPKKALNCRNVKHVKLYLSRKGLNCGGKWPHRHVYIYIYMATYIHTHERWRRSIAKIRANLVFQVFSSFLTFLMKGNLRQCWQFPVSFYKRISRFWVVSDKSGELLFLPCSHRNAAAHT